MRFLELRVKLLSPTIVGAKRTRTGYLSPLRYLPATTLRGAFISALFRSGIVDEKFMESEHENQMIITSPAYPVVNGRKSYPCHPFAYRCKVRHAEEGEGAEGSKEAYEARNYVADIIPMLERGEEPVYKSTCERGHMALKPLHPDPCIPEGRSIRAAETVYHSSISVGVDKHRASSQRGMLYQYEALAAGQEFWATISLPDEICGSLREEIREGLELRIGRGISRGFGRAEIEEIREISLGEEVDRARRAIRNNRVVLYAFSHVFSIDGDKVLPYPRIIDLGEVSAKAGLQSGGKLKITRAFGRTCRYVAGWDMKENVGRPILTSVANPGCIFVAEVSGERIAEGLAALSFMGTVEHVNRFNLACVNLLTPLRGHPMEGT